MTSRVWELVDRHPWLLALLLAGLGWLLVPDRSLIPADFPTFANAGSELLHGRLSQVFADAAVQAGPLAVLGMGLLDLVTSSAPMLVLALCWVHAVCLVQAVRVAIGSPGARRGVLTGFAGAFGVLFGTLVATDAHPTHAVIPLLWFLAARAARRDRIVLSGVLLGLAVGLDTWGLLGAGVLVAVPSWRSAARAAAFAFGVASLLWLPFALAGPIESFSYEWLPSVGSLPRRLLGPEPVPWAYRMAQGLLAGGAGLLVAWRLRGTDQLAWVLPAVVVTVRVMLDPLSFDYYTTPITMMLIAGIAALVAQGASRIAIVLAALALLLPPVTEQLGGPVWGYAPALACLVGLVALLPARELAAGD